MKITITKPIEVEAKTLHVEAGVRYWEDAKINGEPDTENGDNIPCKNGYNWCPIIDIDSGIVLNWEQGKTADIHYKACDAGNYYVRDAGGQDLMVRRGYVPDLLCPLTQGYGDYIIMSITEEGKIVGWKPNFDDFQEED